MGEAGSTGEGKFKKEGKKNIKRNKKAAAPWRRAAAAAGACAALPRRRGAPRALFPLFLLPCSSPSPPSLPPCRPPGSARWLREAPPRMPKVINASRGRPRRAPPRSSRLGSARHGHPPPQRGAPCLPAGTPHCSPGTRRLGEGANVSWEQKRRWPHAAPVPAGRTSRPARAPPHLPFPAPQVCPAWTSAGRREHLPAGGCRRDGCQFCTDLPLATKGRTHGLHGVLAEPEAVSVPGSAFLSS